jgi:hypothetical protein
LWVWRDAKIEDLSEEEATVLRQRELTDENPAGDADVDHRYEVPDDPRRITDDGTLASDDDLIWGSQPSGVSPAPEPVPARVATTRRRLSWGQVLIVLAGGASVVFGIGAVALAGLAGPVTEPVVDMFTFDHTPLLGLIEVAVGAVLLIAGVLPGGRWVAGPVGVAAIVGGSLVLAELDWAQTELAAEQRFGWVPIAIGTAAYLGAMVPTRRPRSMS